MRTLFFSLFLGLMIATPIVAQQAENDFELEAVHFEKCKTSKGWCLVLKTKGKYERMDYPKLKFFINDELVANTDQLYGVVLEDGYKIETNLKTIPKNFECLIVVTTLNRSNGDCFIYKSKEVIKSKK